MLSLFLIKQSIPLSESQVQNDGQTQHTIPDYCNTHERKLSYKQTEKISDPPPWLVASIVRHDSKSLLLSLISIHAFRLSLTPFSVREKFLVKNINLHCLRGPVKSCRKWKLVWSSCFENILRSITLRPQSCGAAILWTCSDTRVMSTWLKKEVWLVSL